MDNIKINVGHYLTAVVCHISTAGFKKLYLKWHNQMKIKVYQFRF